MIFSRDFTISIMQEIVDDRWTEHRANFLLSHNIDPLEPNVILIDHTEVKSDKIIDRLGMIYYQNEWNILRGQIYWIDYVYYS